MVAEEEVDAPMRLKQNHRADHGSPEAQEVVLGVGHDLRDESMGNPKNLTFCIFSAKN